MKYRYDLGEVIQMKKDIHEMLIDLRKAHQYTQSDLAEKLGVSYQAVSKWERGENLPDVYTLLNLADIYGITVDEILRGRLIDKDLTKKVHKRKLVIFIIAVTLLVCSPISIFIYGVEEYTLYVPVILIIAAIAVPLILYATISSEQLQRSTMLTFEQKRNNEMIYVLCAGVFLFIGFVWEYWHPGWIVFVFGYAVTLLVNRKEKA